MRLQATIVVDSDNVYEIEDLLENSGFDDYFSYFNYLNAGSDQVIIEVYSESEDAGDQTADFLEDNGYFIVEYILE
tara:strand:- start:3 stop:230 length:228 start_codon:yes stop_codon:yes gene_type:complete